MASGNEIIVSSEPRGRFTEGYIVGTPKPGTIVQLKAATEPIGGRFTYEPYNQSGDGVAATIAILLPDKLQGKTELDAYADGDRCFLYFPAMGEEFNMLVATSQALAIGDLLIVNDGDGLLVPTAGTPGSQPFQVLETVSAEDVEATGALTHVMYTGH